MTDKRTGFSSKLLQFICFRTSFHSKILLLSVERLGNNVFVNDLHRNQILEYFPFPLMKIFLKNELYPVKLHCQKAKKRSVDIDIDIETCTFEK